jgi:hypothetical protein
MTEPSADSGHIPPESDCAYPLGDARPLEFCGAAVQPGSPYCPSHHALCHLALGSRRERAAFQHIDHMAALAARRREPRPALVPKEFGEPALHGATVGGSPRG